MSDNEIWMTGLILGRKLAPALNFSRGVSLCGVGAAYDPATVAAISPDHSLFGSEIVDHQRRQSRQPLIGQRCKALAQNWNAR